LCRRLAAQGVPVRAITRVSTGALSTGAEYRATGTLGPTTDWAALFTGAHAVVHLASRAHQPPGDESWIEHEAATAAALAQAARTAGIARLLFVSSIKVMGEITTARPFRADMTPAPADAYGRAKLRVEGALQRGPDLVVLRPPLVYGPGVKANFRALMELARRALPLPFASIRNRRSFIYLENLLDLIECGLTHPAAPGQVFLARDDEELSTPALLRHLAHHLGHAARLFPFPPSLLDGALRLVGRGTMANALCRSLSVDDEPTRHLLGWRPRVTLDDALAATCRWFENAR
jgi:UDP-N-acetyl-alpha-D-quinovosamine dehydrogenase